jgi:sec-independent protein translocase protein TatC
MTDNFSGQSPDPEETEGGPVKSFLEHLEDLRWTLIKVASTLMVAMLICLLGGNYLVRLLTYPLDLASARSVTKTEPAITIHWGTNIVAKFERAELSDLLPEAHTNVASLKLVPARIGDAVVLTLQPETNTFVAQERHSVILKNYSPLSAFMVAIKLALYGGLVLSLPFILYFIGQFVLPALKVKEREFVLRSLGFGVFLFVLGMAFCYFLLLQVALVATVEFSTWLGFGADEWRAEDYISFVCMFMLAMGISFELPIVLLALVKIGLLSHETLSRYRPYWVVAELVICAFVTPSGDPFTMILMALPLHLLFEFSILIARYWKWRDRRRALAPQAQS